MAGRTTGEAKIWLALGLFVTGLATAAPSITAAAVDKPLATRVAQSVDVVPVAKRISPIGKTLADLRGTMPHYLGSNTSGEMFWYSYSGGIVVKSTATGPISVANYDPETLSDINPSNGFIDQSGTLYSQQWDSCQIVKLVPGSTVPVDVTKPRETADYDCGEVSPTDGLASGKELMDSANLAFDASGNIYFREGTY